ncbi:6-bladed beta-propeller [Puteibacter caeruleilacunae]|nr:6-bladed beta-propeller [Puteibacter caeruleilacunae]
MKRIHILLISIVILLGCSSSQEEQWPMKIDISKFTANTISLSEIGDDITYIPLKIDVPIRHTLSEKLAGNSIFLYASPEAIFRLDYDGNVLSKIGTRGEGPGEYRYGVTFTVNEQDSLVYVENHTKLITYDFNGNLVKEENREELLRDFATLDYLDGYFYSTAPVWVGPSSPKTYWSVADKNFNQMQIKEDYYTVFSKNGYNLNEKNTYIFSNKMHYWNNYNDTIFEILPTSYKAKYVFINNEKKLTPEIICQPDILKKQTRYFIIRNILETNEYLIIFYRLDGDYNLCMMNKADNTFSLVDSSDEYDMGVPNDIDGGLKLTPYGYQVRGNSSYLISKIQPFELKAHVASEAFKNSTPKYPEKKEALEELANSLSENDNPVLMLVRLKE